MNILTIFININVNTNWNFSLTAPHLWLPIDTIPRKYFGSDSKLSPALEKIGPPESALHTSFGFFGTYSALAQITLPSLSPTPACS